MGAQYTEPTGRIQGLVIKPKNSGQGVDVLGVDENNVVWMWNYYEGCWFANMSIEAGAKQGFKVNEKAIESARAAREASPFRGPGLSEAYSRPAVEYRPGSAEGLWDERQPHDNRGRHSA